MTISAGEVKQLREATGMGMMECKKALQECEGDFEKARDWLRVKSGSKADKVAGRAASEGYVAFASADDAKTGALVEVSCETDFVARDENLIKFANQLAADAAKASDPQSLIGSEATEAARSQLVMKVGENINVSQIITLAAEEGEHLCHYIHAGNKIAAMLVCTGSEAELGREICMHIAAMRPQFLDVSDVAAEVVERERNIFIQQSVESGKPEDIAKKMAEGKLNKYLADITLLNQPYVKEPKQTIAQILKANSASIRQFHLIVVGG